MRDALVCALKNQSDMKQYQNNLYQVYKYISRGVINAKAGMAAALPKIETIRNYNKKWPKQLSTDLSLPISSMQSYL